MVGKNVLVSSSDLRPEGFWFQKPKEISLETKRITVSKLFSLKTIRISTFKR